MQSFTYGEKELEYLKSKDKRLKKEIERIGKIEREVTGDLFAALVSSIVGQQISMKAADTVWRRLNELAGEMTPERVAAMPKERLQSAGMSMRKTEYIQGIARAVVNGEIDLDALWGMTDEQVVGALVKLRGVGVWTAEMLMIFSMQRKDIFSWDDLAIRRGLMMLHRHKELPRERFERYRRRYSPYCSIASLYLWEISLGK
ncbi:MAG: DNA-3-methyladenine glycosylase family protein [Christensenellaceae bacterium]|jgi:DNA-3-methyladenine glycosylase II